jgi:hypothetical protein
MRQAATAPLGPTDRAYFVFTDGGSAHVWSNLITRGGIPVDGGNGLSYYPGIPDIEIVVPTAGYIGDSTLARQFVYQQNSLFAPVERSSGRTARLLGGGAITGGPPNILLPPPKFFRCTFDWSPAGLSMASRDFIAPDVVTPLDIPAQLAPPHLQQRRKDIQATIEANALQPHHCALIWKRPTTSFRCISPFSSREPANTKRP